MRRRETLVLCFALIMLTSCGGGRTLVMTELTTKVEVPTVAVVSLPSSVEVPEEVRLAFQSKLTTLLYTEDTFRQGPDLALQYRFVQFKSGSQFVRWLVGPIGGAGEGSLTVEV